MFTLVTMECCEPNLCSLELLSFRFYGFHKVERKHLDNVDKVIWVLPLLAVFDVVSTLYTESLGYSLALYEVGFFARFFVGTGLIYVYIVIYLLTISGIAYVLWFIKNKKLSPLQFFDKILYIFLVGTACFIYMILTASFTGNLLIPYLADARVSWFSAIFLVYLSTAFTLTVYVWRDVAKWVKAKG
jgi:hypothetical protein